MKMAQFGNFQIEQFEKGFIAMIYGDQWVCKCGCHNLFLRKRCRECDSLESEKIANETAEELVNSRYESGHNLQ
jgi:hypothetical protein